ncbi:T-lymphocyte surface antigen Ly-9-like isoform X2 [Pseudophryne corroboree]|uniref:T-lymphocyte surface antigen Ly-9-like isoform X2 n=1 Tax=Pseudophryne corroboree TaxID=495146 RepID=UPI0030815786
MLLALQSVLLTATLLLSQGEQDVPQQVTGVISLSVDLSPSVDRTCSVSAMYWNFQSYILASFTNHQLSTVNKQFDKRLEMLHDGRTLRISHLRMEDSGLYHVTITCTEPVPHPYIRNESVKNTTNWCNMTLHCSVPTNTSALSYTWKYRHRDTEYQVYNNGDTIQVSLQPESWDMELLCVVHNPADQKNISFHLQEICPDVSNRNLHKMDNQRSYYATFALCLILPLILIGWFLFKKKKRKKEPIRDPPEEIHYADLMLGSQNLCGQVPDSRHAGSHSSQKTSDAIVYSVLRHGPEIKGTDVHNTQHV